MKKVIVTGGAGFIGSHTVDSLVERGAAVGIVDDFSTGKKENIKQVRGKIELFEGSITDAGLLKKAFAGADAVIHLAALPSVPKSFEFPLETNAINATGTLSVFLAARNAGVERVVYASSSSVYGDTPTLPKVETMPTNPLSPYAIQKLTAELYGRIFAFAYGLKTIGLRYFNIFGPRQDPHGAYAAVIPKFIHRIKKGERPVIFGDGEQTRDFTYIKNAVAANLCALDAERGFGKAYNIAAGDKISLNELVGKINEILGTTASPEYAPSRQGDIKNSFADINKARDSFGYKPMVTFEEGLKHTIDSIT
ncbi:SDR family oxidoreductase [Candidatus Kaiserbacteria bacterium]|nr:SDR family oxidoreductase [Candidatus Kaiserbacteria bacterium]